MNPTQSNLTQPSSPVVEGLHGESVEFLDHMTPLQNSKLARQVLIM